MCPKITCKLPLENNELLRRVYAASEARIIGSGGISIVSQITGIHRKAISRGLRELEDSKNLDVSRIRHIGGGRKKLTEIDPAIKEDLVKILDDSTCVSPESPLKWTKKSLHNLEEELNKMGHEVSHTTVHKLLKDLDYSMQGNQKSIEGNSQHPNRDEQFTIINRTVLLFQEKGLPVISVDAKKKELVGNYKNGGKEYHPKGKPPKVNVHDFETQRLCTKVQWSRIVRLPCNRSKQVKLISF